jgi:hypothetical protein
MADPVSLLALGSMAATIGGGLLGAQGAEKAGTAQLEQNYYQAGVAKLNSSIALQNADYALNQGEQQAMEFGIAGGQRLGNIMAAQSSSGLDVNTGSAPLVRAGQKQIIDLDTTQIRSNAAKTAYDYDVQSTQFEQQATLYEMAGTNAAAAGQIKAESSIIGTAGAVSSQWLQGSQVGLSGTGDTLSNAAGNLASSISGFDPFVGL